MPNHSGNRLSVEKVKKALREHHGIILRAAEACGVHRHTMRAFIDKHPELEEVRTQADEELLDVGESWVTTAIKSGDMKTIRWHLERKGKQRGYTQRVEQTGADGAPLEYTEIRRTVVDPETKEPQDE